MNQKMICSLCNKEASIICLCRRPGIYLCLDHHNSHNANLPDFNHVFYAYPISPNSQAKELIQENINKIIKDCRINMQTLFEKREEFVIMMNDVRINIDRVIDKFAEEFNEKQNYLDCFIEDMQTLLEYVDGIHTIEAKHAFSPLENALLSTESANLLMAK